MITYLYYNGEFAGFLSAVFDVYQMKLTNVRVRPISQKESLLFDNQIDVFFEEEKAKRVATKLKEYLGNKGLQSLWRSTLSEIIGIEDTLLEIIRYTFLVKRNVLGNFGHPHVLKLQEILKKIGRETHRMTAFVRFKLANDGIYYATIEPDFDVLPLIIRHFKYRYADQKWLIFDTKRAYGFYYDLDKVIRVGFQEEKKIEMLPVLKIEWDRGEEEFQNLWKCYFKSANIPSRKNTKLHLQYVPKRYWKYLIEKNI